MQAAGKIRVVIADDHAAMREVLALLIGSQPDMQVVGEASDGCEAERLARTERPDVAVVDIAMPHDGISAALAIRSTCPDVMVIALTGHGGPATLSRLRQTGAVGYVEKTSAAATLIDTIRRVVRGETCLPAEAHVEPGATTAHKSLPGGGARLSPREERVLREIAWGRSSKEIAGLLSLSSKTVESYKASALVKLNLRTRSDIVRYALHCGWLSEPMTPDS